MKKVNFISAGFVFVSLVYCKSTKTASAAPAEAGFVPSEKQMTVVEKRWPGSSQQDVKEGQTIFVTKCTNCHKAYEITGFSEKKWLHEIDDMSPKAKLSPEEKLKLTKYILSYREAQIPAGQN